MKKEQWVLCFQSLITGSERVINSFIDDGWEVVKIKRVTPELLGISNNENTSIAEGNFLILFERECPVKIK